MPSSNVDRRNTRHSLPIDKSVNWTSVRLSAAKIPLGTQIDRFSFGTYTPRPLCRGLTLQRGNDLRSRTAKRTRGFRSIMDLNRDCP